MKKERFAEKSMDKTRNAINVLNMTANGRKNDESFPDVYDSAAEVGEN